MSRRTRANADRQLDEGKTNAGASWSRAVYVQQPRSRPRARAEYYPAAAGDDPNSPKTKLFKCTSCRLARARREVKFMNGVRLYRRVEGQYLLV